MDPVEGADPVEGNKERFTGACSSCHRRKLKCDRMPVCSNCRKTDIPCVYTPRPSRSVNSSTTRNGRKKVRGPYQKGRTVREKELEHVVELLQEKCAILEAEVTSLHKTSPGNSHSNENVHSQRSEISPTSTNQNNQPIFTLTSAQDKENEETSILDTTHPSSTQVLELWLIYTASVDPVTKILHCPTVMTTILDAIKSHPTMKNLLMETECLLLSIYVAAINVLEPEQVYQRFTQSKESLMRHYSSHLDRLFPRASEPDTLTFQGLQALVIYLVYLRRQTGPGDNISALFALAVRSARNLKLDDATAYLDLSPLDAELRRRTWWMICRHEFAYAEEIHRRRQSIMYDTDILLPGNFDDRDLDTSMTRTEMPAPRIGVTDMSFVLMLMEIARLVGRLSKLFIEWTVDADIHGMDQSVRSSCLKEHSKKLVGEAKARMSLKVLQSCSASRPFDWFLLIVTKMLLTKVEVMLLNYSPTSDPTAINAFHDVKVGLSLDIIECHQLLLIEPKLDPWRWLYRNTQQWHSMIYVLEEMARRPDAPFVDRAWKVIDVVFADMELLNKHGMRAEDRARLLEGHGMAIEARGRVLALRGLNVAGGTTAFGDPNGVGGTNDMPLYSELMRSEPWQIDQSLFDVQEAQLASMEDPFFWPST